MNTALTPPQALALLRQQRIDLAVSTLERDTPIRQRFHAFLETEGFRRYETPPLGASYNGSHVDLLWTCYLAATLAERALDKQQKDEK
jgi:hypothetical protein